MSNLSMKELALNFLRADAVLLILPKENGKTTVVLDKSSCEEKMTELLQDMAYYKISKDPTLLNVR